MTSSSGREACAWLASSHAKWFGPNSASKMIFEPIGRWAVRFRWAIVAAWIVAAVGVVHFLPSLSSVSQSSNASFVPLDAPSAQSGRMASSLQRTGQTLITVVAARTDHSLTLADQAAIASLEQSLLAVPGVTAVTDVARSPTGEAEQLRVFAQTGQTTTLDPSGSARSLVAELRSTFSSADLPPGLEVHLAGPVATAVDNNATAEGTGTKVQRLSLVFIVVLLLAVFRSVLAPVVTVVPAFIVVVIAGPLTAEATNAGLQVSQIAQLLQIVLVLGAGTDYSLFLVFRVREELRRGLAPKEAVVEAVMRVGESITFSAATVIGALLSLLAASFGFYSGLGVPLAIGIGLMLLAGLTLLPAILAILGPAAFWPSKVSLEARRRIGWWGRVSGRVVSRPITTLVAGLLLFGALSAISPGFQATGLLGGAANAPNGTDSAAGNALLTRYFRIVAANPTLIVFRLRQPAWENASILRTAQTLLASEPEFSAVSGPLDTGVGTLTPTEFMQLHETLGPASSLPASPPASTSITPSVYEVYRASAQYISADGLIILFATALTVGDPTSASAVASVPLLRADAARVSNAIDAAAYGVAGQAPTSYDIGNLSSKDLHTVIPIAIAVIAVLLAIVLRSLIAPLYLIASVALSYFAALGLTVLLFIWIGAQGGLIFILPFLMFVFLLALGEDYNILVMTRIREEAQGLPLRNAVANALSATGTTITSAGLVLAGTFGVFAVLGIGGAGANSIALRDIGAGLAIGILMDTFLVRTLLVPSTVVILGRWNWWPVETYGSLA
jgi:putative drug exporter of the RND superfamily